MPTVLQFRRGTTSQNNAFTGALGELSIDTTLDTLRIHDGSSAGGFAMVSETATQTLTNKTLTSPKILGDTSAGDDAAIGYTSTEGLILTGQGSTNDVTIKNDADADVLEIPTGTTNVDIVGVATAATFEPDGDTSAGDNAAIGYTAAEGLILTGQGSTNDVTIKNDADADVLEIPTGTTTVTTTGRLQPTTFSTGVVVLAATDAITAAEHAGKTLSMADVGGNTLCTFTLPAATGTGDIYRFHVGIVNTSNYVIKVPDASHTIKGQVVVQNDSTEGGTASVIGWKADGTDDTITLNGTTTGGASIGDYVEIVDLLANQYIVSGMLHQSGTEASPFSATVS